jgi:GDP-mannose pyrophosphatase NudK
MRAMDVEILGRTCEYDGVYRLDRYRLRQRRLDGQWSQELTRLVFERGDSVAVLLYDRASRCVLLVEQFRLPAYLREGGDGLLWEIVAGSKDGARQPKEVARAELLEEAGLNVTDIEHVATFYLSPGACTERLHLFVGYLSDARRVAQGGGVPGSGEDIEVRKLALDEALLAIRQGEICDAKTIIALQYLALMGEQG